MEVRALRAEDWPSVARIYAEGIATGNATFETSVPTWERWDAGHLAEHRLVAEDGGRVLGWAALSPVSDRCCYAGVAEGSVYVAGEARGRGIGTALLRALVEGAENAGIWTIQTGMFPENESSVRLHRRCGFRVIGVRERLGELNGVWRDVLLLERRSRMAGRHVDPVPNPRPPRGMEETVAGASAQRSADFVPISATGGRNR